MKITCKNHKTYRGIRKPTANCLKCRLIFASRRILKACGITVAEALRAPKSEAKKVGEFCNEFGVAVLAPTKAAGLEADPEFPGVAFGAGPSIRYNATPEQLAQLADEQDVLASVKLGAEKRIETFEGQALGFQPAWRTPEVAAQLQAHARGELTEHQSTAFFLKLHDAGAFTGAVAVRREQVRNIGPEGKAE